MADQRLKGQEVTVQVVVAGQLSLAFTAVASFSDTMKMESKEQGYLGEVTNRTDDIFNGWDGTLNMHVSNQKWMEFQALIKARAQRSQPDIVFNLVRTDFYPNGETPSRTYEDVSWGAIPTNVASRGDYVTVDLPFMCSDTDDNLQTLL